MQFKTHAGLPPIQEDIVKCSRSQFFETEKGFQHIRHTVTLDIGYNSLIQKNAMFVLSNDMREINVLITGLTRIPMVNHKIP